MAASGSGIHKPPAAMNTTTVKPSTEILSAFTAGQVVDITLGTGEVRRGTVDWANVGGFQVKVGRSTYTVSADMSTGVDGGARYLRMWNANHSNTVTNITVVSSPLFA